MVQFPKLFVLLPQKFPRARGGGGGVLSKIKILKKKKGRGSFAISRGVSPVGELLELYISTPPPWWNVTLLQGYLPPQH